MAALQALDAGRGQAARVGLRRGLRRGVDGARDRVDAVEGAGEDEGVVGGEVLQARREGAVVD